MTSIDPNILLLAWPFHAAPTGNVPFVAIGLCISALTLIGYFFVGDAFDLWMAFVNGGGLVLGGHWMRRS